MSVSLGNIKGSLIKVCNFVLFGPRLDSVSICVLFTLPKMSLKFLYWRFMSTFINSLCFALFWGYFQALYLGLCYNIVCPISDYSFFISFAFLNSIGLQLFWVLSKIINLPCFPPQFLLYLVGLKLRFVLANKCFLMPPV